VVVADDLGRYESMRGPKRKAEFKHNFGLGWEDLGTRNAAIATANSVRNVRSENDFWVTQLIYGYEYSEDSDYDPDGDQPVVLGNGVPADGDGPAYVLFETARDFRANPPPLLTVTVTYAQLIERTSLHEASHKFNMRHGQGSGVGDEGPLNAFNVLRVQNDMSFTLRQLAQIRSVDRPK
jgi:hypothetical protein